MALTAAEEAQTRELLAQQASILSLADSEAAIISNLGATDVSLSDLTAASTIDDADLLLIRQGATDKSIAGSVVKLAATPGDASTTVKGIVELATNAEAQTGTDAVRAVTPSTLASVTATETRAGLVELATVAEAQGFTANKFIDGEKLAEAFKGSNYSLAANGYQKLPSGLIIQWGSIAFSGNTSASPTAVATLPILFPNAALQATASANANSDVAVQVITLTTSQITLYADAPVAVTGATGVSGRFIVIGY